MGRYFFIILFFVFQLAYAQVEQVDVYCKNNKFGLIKGEEKITEAKYIKLIRLHDTSWLFLYGNKFGLMDNSGNVIVEPKYNQAARYFGKYVKLGYKGKYCIYDYTGKLIIKPEYTNIEILFGRMFLVEKKNKFGLISFDGDLILPCVADDIYMPDKHIIRILHNNIWYEIEQKNKQVLQLPDDLLSIKSNDSFSINTIVQQPITATGYGIVSMGDYFIKLFSAISPAYEKTIDELVLDYGADTALILTKTNWFLKFPYTYSKKYINELTSSNNGPFSRYKTNLKSKIK